MKQDDGKLQVYLTHRLALVEYATPLVGDRSRAEDVVQDAFIRFVPADTAQPAEALHHPLGYLYRIVRNLALDRIGAIRRERRMFLADNDAPVSEIASELPSPEQVVASQLDYDRLAQALDELPPDMRIAVEMHRFSGAKLREIAAELNVSVAQAHRLVVDGVARCRTKLR